MAITAFVHNLSIPCGAGCAPATELVDRWTLTGISLCCCACICGERARR